MIERLFASSAPSETEEEEETEEGDDMKLTSLQSITDFMTCAGKTLPDHIRLWARRNLAVAKSHEVSPEERRHAQRALSIMMNVRWKHDYFEAIDPVEASSRVYANAKPGIIMEAFSMAGESNLVFIINELDKAASGKGNGNPADVLLTLLDNLGFTDNYMECMVPTSGVYPIATANNKEQISAPLMSRFAVIDIPDYTPEEKKIIFSKFALPKILRRMSLRPEECILTDEALDMAVKLHSNTSGIRDLEQAAEHLAANALYQIEVDHLEKVVFDGKMVRELLG